MKNNIEQMRKLKAITQEEMARKLEISLSQYRNIEKDRCVTSVEIAIKIAKILNKKVEDIFIPE